MSAEPTTPPADELLVLDAERVIERGMDEFCLPAGPIRPRPGVLAAYALDAMALYDPRAERYLTLNPVATRVWEGLVAGELPAVIAKRIAAAYGVPEAQVQADVAAQLAGWLAGGLVECATAVSASTAAGRTVSPQAGGLAAARQVALRIPCFVARLLIVAQIKRSLQRRRFEGTLTWIRAEVGGVPASEDTPLEQVQALEYAVAMAGAFYPGRAKCLEQSLTLYLLARRQGIAVRYCQAMQLYPFEAHAWIEYQGEVINDVPEHVKHFTKFPDQLP
jgi:hypothetical protein